MNRTGLARKTRATAANLLREKGYVSAVDVLMALGRLSKENYERWRTRQVPHLEKVLPGSLNQHAFFLRELRAFARAGNLKPSRTAYVSWGKGKRQPLRFTKFGEPHLEEAYSTHYIGERLLRSRRGGDGADAARPSGATMPTEAEPHTPEQDERRSVSAWQPVEKPLAALQPEVTRLKSLSENAGK